MNLFTTQRSSKDITTRWKRSVVHHIILTSAVYVCQSLRQSQGWVPAEGRISCAVVFCHCELMMLTLM